MYVEKWQIEAIKERLENFIYRGPLWPSTDEDDEYAQKILEHPLLSRFLDVAANNIANKLHFGAMKLPVPDGDYIKNEMNDEEKLAFDILVILADTGDKPSVSDSKFVKICEKKGMLSLAVFAIDLIMDLAQILIDEISQKIEEGEAA